MFMFANSIAPSDALYLSGFTALIGVNSIKKENILQSYKTMDKINKNNFVNLRPLTNFASKQEFLSKKIV